MQCSSSSPPASGRQRNGGSSRGQRYGRREMTVLHGGTTPNLVTAAEPDDVLLGRGSPNAFHSGNVRFREFLEPFKAVYMGTSRHHRKQAVAEEIWTAMEQRGVRFLRAVRVQRGSEIRKEFLIVSTDVAMEKIKQALREKDAPNSRSNDTITIPGELAAGAASIPMNVPSAHQDDESSISETESTDDDTDDRKPSALTVVASPQQSEVPTQNASQQSGDSITAAQPATAPTPETNIGTFLHNMGSAPTPQAFPVSVSSGTRVSSAAGARLDTPPTGTTPAPVAAAVTQPTVVASNLVPGTYQHGVASCGQNVTMAALGQLDDTRRRIQAALNQQRITGVELQLLAQRQQQEALQLAFLQQQEQQQQQALATALTVWGTSTLPASTATVAAPTVAAPAPGLAATITAPAPGLLIHNATVPVTGPVSHLNDTTAGGNYRFLE